MEFSLDRFYSLNRRAIIWVVLFALIWLLKDFFTLIFLTFVTAFFAFPASRFLMERLRFNRVLAITTVHVALLVGYGVCVWWISPNFVREVGTLKGKLDGIQENIQDVRERYEKEYPALGEILKEYVPEDETTEKLDYWRDRSRAELTTVAKNLFRFAGTFLLAILFSFLVLYDYFRLVKVVQSLQSSKLRDFYEEAGQPVVKFALAVGRGFQALATIAFITTLMMIPVMIYFRVPSITAASVIVFLSSLVPVIGVFFQAVPLGLITLNAHGVDTAIWVMVWLGIVHMINGYIVAPYIFGRHFRLNVVLTLIILFIGGRFFGVWGVVLGIPIANYLIRDVFAVPIVEELEGKTSPFDQIAAGEEKVTLAPKDSPPAQKA